MLSSSGLLTRDRCGNGERNEAAEQDGKVAELHLDELIWMILEEKNGKRRLETFDALYYKWAKHLDPPAFIDVYASRGASLMHVQWGDGLRRTTSYQVLTARWTVTQPGYRVRLFLQTRWFILARHLEQDERVDEDIPCGRSVPSAEKHRIGGHGEALVTRKTEPTWFCSYKSLLVV